MEAEQLRVRLEKGKAKASPDACTEEGEPRSRPNKRRRTSDDEAPSTAKNGVVDLAAEEEEDEDEDAAYPDFVPSSDVEEQAIQDDSIVDCPMGTHKHTWNTSTCHLDSGCKLHTYKLGRRRGTAGNPHLRHPIKTNLPHQSLRGTMSSNPIPGRRVEIEGKGRTQGANCLQTEYC